MTLTKLVIDYALPLLSFIVIEGGDRDVGKQI